MSTHNPDHRWICPVCRQPVHERRPKVWNPEWDRPQWSHLDGEATCPIRVMGGGYKHASPVRVRRGDGR